MEDEKNLLQVEDDGKEPFVALVPMPASLIDEVTVDFQMEVTDASTSKSAENEYLCTATTGNLFGVSGSVQGKIGTSREATRSTDQTAKYQVSKSASQQSQTEGLSKMMDIIKSCIEPLDTKE